ncbi:hypothetical protein ABL78_7205 [Leptomonas seymouri]|uniref:Uncharacterized protein n=1 Tax=Leptomonas seymouri TaxID=5684 RepID=A0A0N1HZW1_LEPSE|nr:hypothetical protein ABL78_7205 [Leptomonas seymouri]|eukprot:KPI83750.1 hypothetical protein ABL78_7205 [Leptomonas seymouri]
MVRILKPVFRFCGVAIGAHVALCSSLFLCSLLGRDKEYEEHWRYSKPTLRTRGSYVAFWMPGFFSPVLTSEERECLDVWMHTISLHPPLFATIQISPKVVLHDSMALLQGISELRDGLYILEKLPISVEPYLQEVRREYQDEVVFLHGRTRTDIALRVPFTTFTMPLFALPASFTLQLERTHSHGQHLHITAVEHRWFNGLLLSHLTNSVSSPWGDVGDLCRRWNGFLWSAMATKKISLAERRRAFVEMTAHMEEKLKRQQEEQIRM